LVQRKLCKQTCSLCGGVKFSHAIFGNREGAQSLLSSTIVSNVVDFTPLTYSYACVNATGKCGKSANGTYVEKEDCTKACHKPMHVSHVWSRMRLYELSRSHELRAENKKLQKAMLDLKLKLSPAPAPFCTKHQYIAPSTVLLGSWYIKTGGEPALKSGWKGPPLKEHMLFACHKAGDVHGCSCSPPCA
jgi:hypothetical protein